MAAVYALSACPGRRHETSFGLGRLMTATILFSSPNAV